MPGRPGYAGNFCPRQGLGFNCLAGFAGSFCCRDLLPLPGPDPQGVSVAGIVLHLPGLDLQDFLLQ